VNKTPDPGEVVRDKVIPAAEELVAAIAERVGPFAKEAVDQVTPVAQAAAEKTVALAHAAAEKVGPLTHQAVEVVTPYAQQTRDAVLPYAHQAADAVSPYAQQVAPFAQQAAERVGPLAQQAADAVAPYATLLVEQGRRSGHDLADRLEPALEAAKDAFSGARDRVTSDVLPAVGAAATAAAASATPLVAAATERGKALVQSARGAEPVVVLPPPKKKRGWLTTVAVVAAAAGATYVLVRRLVGDKGSQWQAARPSTPYEPPVSAEAGVATPTAETAPAAENGDEVLASTTSLYGTAGTGGDAASGTTDDTDAEAVSAHDDTVTEAAEVDEGDDTAAQVATPDQGSEQASGEADTWGEGSATDAGTPYSDEHIEQDLATAEERVYEEPESAVWAEQDSEMGGGPDAHPERYDLPGVYVGVEPPTGYTIKGNERSMKYHTPDSNSYGRTIAQIWFDSEEAAERAGFSRAQH
jgi:hypothetical protein